MSLNLWKITLPASRAFNIVIDKTLRKFFEGLSFPDDFRDQADRLLLNIDPQETDNLSLWEDQFYLKSQGLTVQQRRDKLEAAWKLTGGQSPAYLQNILRSYGFDVYVHDWWQPDAQNSDFVMGSDVSYMGDQYSYMGANFGMYPSPWNPNDVLVSPYYPLVNKITARSYTPWTLGSDVSYMGSEFSYMGQYVEVLFDPDYEIPSDPEKWRYFIYVAGEEMTDPAYVPEERKNEFEELILSIFPADKWVGVVVEYV